MKTLRKKNTSLEITFLGQKLENIFLKEKWWHQNFASELSGSKKIINFFIGQKILMKSLISWKCGFWKSFHISLSRADIVNNCDKRKVPRRSRWKFCDFDISYVLSKNAYFSQEERHKQGKPFFFAWFSKVFIFWSAI